MSFEIIEKNKVLREVIITVPGSVVKSVEGRMVAHACKTVKMNGFRTGKVPAAVIRQKAGDSIMEDARRESLQNEAREALASIDKLIHAGEVDIVTPKTEDGGFVAKLEVEIEPVVEVVDYKGLEVTVPAVNVTDDDGAAALEKKREANSVLEPVADRKTVEDGDIVMTTLSAPNAAAEKICRAGDRQISVGKGYLNADMEKCLVGVTLGEPVQLSTNDEEPAIVTCVVNEIKKRVLPALDDAFALDTGEADTLEALKDVTKKKLVEEAEKERKNKIEEKILAQLRDKMPIDIPENYVKARAAQAVRLQLEQMTRQRIDDALLARITANMRDEEVAEYRVDYHNEVILNALADAAKYEVKEEEILEEAKKWLPNMSEDKLKHWLKANKASEFIGDQIKRDRALAAVVDSANVKDEA